MADAHSLADLAEIIEAGLEDVDRACGTYADDPRNWHARHRIAMEDFAQRLESQLGARVNDRRDATRFRLGGISTSSTTGLRGALNNWLRRARAQSEGTQNRG